MVAALEGADMLRDREIPTLRIREGVRENIVGDKILRHNFQIAAGVIKEIIEPDNEAESP